MVRHWIMAFRPKTLTAAVVPIIAGTALVMALQFSVQWWISICALMASLFIQIGTNLVNDAVDFKKGADTEKRIGPQRVTQSGLFSGKIVMATAGVFFFLALLCGIPLVYQGGWPIVLIGLISICCGYAYTAGPFPLAYRGMGDLFVILFFGVVAVMGLVFLHIQEWRIEAFILGLQVGFHCTVLIAINNLRDVDGDRLVNKRTLPVRFGKTFARWEIAFLCLVPFVIQLYWFSTGFWKAGVLGFLILPLALQITKLVFHTEPSPIYNQYLAKAAGLHLAFGLLVTLGFFI
ncbi:MAG: 1,4-dihydroxy-2-naphthoate octaprenyltransferase [Oligoflexia bacterium]|nr:MAG: 1,4-dihydroxy-2-naphthoate octaprenyltransferase [Oligoflexia bacterium]